MINEETHYHNLSNYPINEKLIITIINIYHDRYTSIMINGETHFHNVIICRH